MATKHRHGGSAEQALELLHFMEEQGRGSVSALLDALLRKSRELTHAEAGTFFLLQKVGRQRRLRPTCLQNDVVPIRKTDYDLPVDERTIAGHVALRGDTLMIGDVYRIPKSRAYRFDPRNERHDYRTQSMLCFPLHNFEHRIIGVVQLINCRPRKRGAVTPFPKECIELVMPIAHVAGDFIERAMMMEKIKQKNRALKSSNQQLASQRQQISALQSQTEEAFQASIRLLARAAQLHDEETGAHLLRVNEYSYTLARLAGMPEAWCNEIRYSAQLHDVGKMSVDSAILKKQGPLSATERTEMNRHTVYGHRILDGSPRMAMGAEIAHCHHERWDGSGYPRGLRGDAIPLSARIVQLADVYDALRSARPYKPAFSHEEAVRILREGDERIRPEAHYDPALLALLLQHHQRFAEIWERMKD